MKKIFALSICLFMLASCEYEELFEASEYPVQNYEISNAADGVYSIKYQERTGFPDQCVDVEVKKSDDIVYKYSTDWKGDRVLPEKLYTFLNMTAEMYFIFRIIRPNHMETMCMNPNAILFITAMSARIFLDIKTM